MKAESNEEFRCDGQTNIGAIKVLLLRKPYTNKYKVKVTGFRDQVTDKITGFEAADATYQKITKAIKNNPFTDISTL